MYVYKLGYPRGNEPVVYRAMVKAWTPLEAPISDESDALFLKKQVRNSFEAAILHESQALFASNS